LHDSIVTNFQFRKKIAHLLKNLDIDDKYKTIIDELIKEIDSEKYIDTRPPRQ
jgi:hypothetical protein